MDLIQLLSGILYWKAEVYFVITKWFVHLKERFNLKIFVLDNNSEPKKKWSTWEKKSVYFSISRRSIFAESVLADHLDHKIFGVPKDKQEAARKISDRYRRVYPMSKKSHWTSGQMRRVAIAGILAIEPKSFSGRASNESCWKKELMALRHYIKMEWL